WSERKRRQTGGEIDQAKQNRLVGEPTEDPALRHHLHPRAAVGNERTNDVATKRALPQKRQRFRSNSFFFLVHRNTHRRDEARLQWTGVVIARDVILSAAKDLPKNR